MTGADGYVMGRSSAETGRLLLQAEVLAPHSAHLFRLAGILPGMRVLDVGCGAGDVSMLLAGLVGPAGSVIGVDIDPAILELARARTTALGLTSVSFVEADLTDLRLDQPVDALAGRLILMHLKEPVATVRALSVLVRAGGIVTFQDYNVTRSRAVPPTPLTSRRAGWMTDALRAAGVNPEIGDQIAPILREAGLSFEGAAAASPAGSADSALVASIALGVRSVLPVLLASGIATEAEVDIDTFADRLALELREAGATYYGAELVAAWARVP